MSGLALVRINVTTAHYSRWSAVEGGKVRGLVAEVCTGGYYAAIETPTGYAVDATWASYSHDSPRSALAALAAHREETRT